MNQAIPRPLKPGGKDIAFTDDDFRMIAKFASAQFGLHLQDSKKPLVYSRLAKRMAAVSAPDMQTYRKLLDDPDQDAERSHFLSALTTNVTHFFREMHHFDFLRDKIAPGLLAKAKAGKPVRIWSSACSSGQEPYSLAALLHSVSPEFAAYDVKILATDIDPKIVNAARDCRYPVEQIEALPRDMHKLMVQPDTQHDGYFHIKDTLRSMISFGELNLIGDWPMRRPFDVIFCRNVAIYFEKSTQSKLWHRLADALVPNGHLMIGHSERLNGPATQILTNVGITTYQRQQGASA